MEPQQSFQEASEVQAIRGTTSNEAILRGTRIKEPQYQRYKNQWNHKAEAPEVQSVEPSAFQAIPEVQEQGNH